MLLQLILIVSVFHVIVFFIGKYYFCYDLVRAKDDEKIKKSYPAFIRDDIDNLSVLWSFPFYSTYLIRMAVGWFNIITCCFFCMIAVIGAEDLRNLSPNRHSIVKKLVQFNSYIGLKIAGYPSLTSEKVFVDYSKYLGPG